MTYQARQPPHLRLVGIAQSSTRQDYAAAAPTAISAARTSTTLAVSMMVALRYLEGRASRSAVPSIHAIPDPALS